MFTQMRSVITLQHALAYERMRTDGKGAGPDVPERINPREVLAYATIEGARASGLDDGGTLTPGKEADVIMLRTDRINVMPINDPFGAVVLGMDNSNVDSVFMQTVP